MLRPMPLVPPTKRATGLDSLERRLLLALRMMSRLTISEACVEVVIYRAQWMGCIKKQSQMVQARKWYDVRKLIMRSG